MFEKWFELSEQPYTAEDAAWDAFVAAHPHGSILQTTNWARLKNRFGWSSQRVWLKRDGQFVAGAQVLYKSSGLGLAKIGYIPHGPLVDWNDDEQTAVLFNQIDQAAFQRGVGIVKLEPLLWQDAIPAGRWQAICDTCGLIPTADTIQPPRTILIDLRPDEDAILAAMKQKTRYNVRLAARKDVIVRTGTPADIPAFYQLMRSTGARDGFGIHARDYYRAAYELFAPDHAALLLAEYDGKPLAGIMVFAFGGTGYYLYGASGDAERQRMPAYALQWEAIRWARERGCTTYDMWGVPDADEAELEAGFTERTDGLWPVYRTKRGYGGSVRRTVGAVDRVYNRLLYRLYNWRRRR